MPQMAPMNWLMLMMFFLTVYLLFNMMNYYSFNLKINKNNINLKKMNKFMPWKW